MGKNCTRCCTCFRYLQFISTSASSRMLIQLTILKFSRNSKTAFLFQNTASPICQLVKSCSRETSSGCFSIEKLKHGLATARFYGHITSDSQFVLQFQQPISSDRGISAGFQRLAAPFPRILDACHSSDTLSARIAARCLRAAAGCF